MFDPHGWAISIAPGRDGYFATWISDAGLNAASIDSYGRIEHLARIPKSGLTKASTTLTARNGAVHLVLSGLDGPFTATLFDEDADVLVDNIPIGDTRGDPSTRITLTADSAGFLVLSTKQNALGRVEIYGRRVSTGAFRSLASYGPSETLKENVPTGSASCLPVTALRFTLALTSPRSAAE